MDRFEEKVSIVPITGCWMWLGCILNHGRGQIRVSPKRAMQTHRYAYETYVGKIPDGLELDHLCRNGWCCNPSHLEPVTGEENRRRYLATLHTDASSTQCKKGHALDEINTRIDAKGRRHCRACEREYLTGYYARKGRPVKRPTGPHFGKTHCVNGHPRDRDTRIDSKGNRVCMGCKRLYDRRRRRPKESA